MIDRLQLENFQRHDKLRVTLDDEITAIVGPSDTGKSTIIRAIRWLALNKPRGVSFIKHGEKVAAVKMRVDGTTVTRTRSKSENGYKIGNKELKAFGSDVPEDITRLLGLTDVHFQMQHEPPFWFSLTAGEVAKELNKIVDLSIIDQVVSDLGSQRRKVTAELNVVDSRLSDAREDIASLDFVEELKGQWDRLREQEVMQVEVTENRVRMTSLLERVSVYQQTASDVLQARKNAESVVSVGKKWEDLEQRSIKLGKLIKSLEEMQSIVEETPPALPKSYEQLSEQVRSNWKLLKCFLRLMRTIVDMKGTVEEAQAKRDEQKMLLDEEFDICPLCGGKLNE